MKKLIICVGLVSIALAVAFAGVNNPTILSDTLDTILNRGNTSTLGITAGGFTTTGKVTAATISVSGNMDIGGNSLTNSRYDVTVITSTNDYTLTALDSGKLFAYKGAGTWIVNLPSVDIDDVGLTYNIASVFNNSNAITIDAADTDRIDDSQTVTNTYVSTGSNIVQSVQIVLCDSNWWHVVRGRGTWTATQ